MTSQDMSPINLYVQTTSKTLQRIEERGSHVSCSGGYPSDACARMQHCASFEPPKLLRDDGLRDPQFNQRSSELGPFHLSAVEDPHESRASVLVAQEEVYIAANKAADA